MAATLLGRKVGMTRVFTPEGVNVPVTVIAAGPCFVTQVKSADSDGYAAVQIAFEDIKARNSTRAEIAHDQKAGVSPKRFHREFRVEEADLANYAAGQELNVGVFEGIKYVDVVSTSKGKGFQGTMKRWNFKGQLASHGVERKHRSPGSQSGHGASRGGSGGAKKGKKMSGQMGDEQVTVRSLDVIGIDKDNNLVLVKGPVPGGKNALILLRESKRLYKRKARLAQAS